AIQNNLDVVAIISSDSSYIPLLRGLKSLGITVVLVSWNFDHKPDEPNYRVGTTANELIKESLLYLPMEEIITEGLKNKDEIVEGVIITRTNPIYDVSGGSEFINNEVAEEEELLEEGSKHIGEVLILKSGYGFVKHPNNNLFFHYLDVLGGFSELKEGDKVEYTIGKNKDGNDVAKTVCKVLLDAEGNVTQRFDTKNGSDEI
ncbi:MAG: cold shock domain-containing protein, partial [Rikenellaceae bacterium]